MKGPLATFVGLGVLLLLLIVGLTPNSLIAAIASVAGGRLAGGPFDHGTPAVVSDAGVVLHPLLAVDLEDAVGE